MPKWPQNSLPGGMARTEGRNGPDAQGRVEGPLAHRYRRSNDTMSSRRASGALAALPQSRRLLWLGYRGEDLPQRPTAAGPLLEHASVDQMQTLLPGEHPGGLGNLPVGHHHDDITAEHRPAGAVEGLQLQSANRRAVEALLTVLALDHPSLH